MVPINTSEMKYFIILPLTLFFLDASRAFAQGATPTAQTTKPNIIIILADDLGYADVGFQGCKDIPTPHIDSLARNGLRFTSGYVSGPYCSPTRAGLMTGRYQERCPAGEYLTGSHGNRGLNLKETTIAERLHRAGYATGIVGKWHLGRDAGYHPLDRGFDEFFGFLGGGHYYFPEPRGASEAERKAGYTSPIMRNRESVGEKDYLTTAFGREAAAFVNRHKDQPFFLYLAFNAVHTPLEAPENYLARFPELSGKRRTMAAMLAAMDDATGEVLNAVKSAGLEERTLIFFLSDNGAPVTHNAPNGSRNTPLRGEKGETWEGGVRVPFVAQWKGTLPAGETYAQPVIQLDIAATAFAVAGLTPEPEWQLDGVDLLPFLMGNQSGPPHTALYWRLGCLMAVIDGAGQWKLITPYVGRESMQPPPTGYDWLAHARLFRLGGDISETTDLTGQYPDKVKELGTLWSKWNAEMSPAIIQQ